MASCGMLQPLRWMLVISEAHRIYARLRMPMLHMRMFIIIAIAKTFTMSLLSLRDCGYYTPCGVACQRAIVFSVSCTEKGITFRDLNEKRIAAAWLTPHPTEKIAFVGSVVPDAPLFPKFDVLCFYVHR